MKKLLLKITSSVFFQKIKAWFEKVGLTSLGYLAIAVGVWFIPLGPLAVIKGYMSVSAASIFTYINFNTIVKLIKKEK